MDEFLAHFLVLQGFESLQDIASTPEEELMQLEGFTLEIAQELRNRVLEALEEEEKNCRNLFIERNGDPRLLDLCSPYMLEALVNNEILTLKDFSQLSVDELEGYVTGARHGMSSEALGELIMQARVLYDVDSGQA